MLSGFRTNAAHAQMYMLEGCSRWNINRGRAAVELQTTSGTSMYNLSLMAAVNQKSAKVLGKKLIPEFTPPGKPTGNFMNNIKCYMRYASID